MTNAEKFSQLLIKVRSICTSIASQEEKLYKICGILNANIKYYNWVGFYLTDPQTERELVLGPYVGTPTEHTRIPFGRGICGQAAQQAKTYIVQDVSLETNYLSCSPDVRAEIVLPVFKNGNIVGELDIDSHQLAPFTEDDYSFLKEVCAIVAEVF